jgi:hypothetical protein
MKTKQLLTILILIITICVKAQVNQADSSKTQQVVLTKKDGTEYIGAIISDDGREVLMDTRQVGKMYILKSEITSIVKVKESAEIVNGEYASTGPFTTRYAFTNNALPIVKGENYRMINLYGPEIHFAVTDNLNVGIMTTWIASPMVLALKYSFKTADSKVNFSVGTLIGTSGYIYNFRGYGGLHWVSMTLGSRKNNITFSGGYAYLQTGVLGHLLNEGVYYGAYPQGTYTKMPMIRGPVFSIAAIWKVGAKASIVFDSMFGSFTREATNTVQEVVTPGGYTYNPTTYTPPAYRYVVTKEKFMTTAFFLMPGMRFQHKERSAFQICLASVSVLSKQNSISFPLPMCSWFHKF